MIDRSLEEALRRFETSNPAPTSRYANLGNAPEAVQFASKLTSAEPIGRLRARYRQSALVAIALIAFAKVVIVLARRKTGSEIRRAES